MYVIPYVEKYFENYDEYNVGDIVEYSNNGVDRWVVVGKEYWCSSSLVLIPETPIELVIESVDDNINEKANQIIESFNHDVNSCGNYVDYFGTDNLPNLIPNFLNQQTEKIIFPQTNCGYSKDGNELKFNCGSVPIYENGNFGYTEVVYTEQGPKTLGYRPVVTLKVKEKLQDKDKKEISSKIQVGDNVKYEAKGYKNWKVLSIDKDNNTVDIISGGIAKNLTLSGKEDWDNYEDIIQKEVDEYKNGAQSKKATTVTSKDLKILKEIDKNILSRYWILSKSSNINYKGTYPYQNEKIYYNVESVYLKKLDNYESYIDNIVIYVDIIYENAEGADSYFQPQKDMYDYINLSSYTAGLRPVITLRLDSVEKLPDEETKKIEESTEKQERVLIREQESKNKDYKGPSKVDDSTSSTGNNNEVKSNDNDSTKKDNITDNNTSNVEKIVYKDKPSTRYQLIIQYVIIVLQLGVIIYLLLKRKNN